jgi:hypothetical protein
MEEPMKMDQLPAHAAHKLLVLDQERRALDEEADQLAKRIAFSRRVFAHEIEDENLDVRTMYQEFDALVSRERLASQRRGAAAFVFEGARRWVAGLPDDVVLETAATKVPADADLHGVRSRIAEAEAEVAAMERAPVLDPKIREKVEAHVSALGSSVQIRGIQAGETLVISTRDSSGWERDLTPLQVQALLEPTKLAAAFLARIEALAAAPAPPAARPARIAARWSARSWSCGTSRKVWSPPRPRLARPSPVRPMRRRRPFCRFASRRNHNRRRAQSRVTPRKARARRDATRVCAPRSRAVMAEADQCAGVRKIGAQPEVGLSFRRSGRIMAEGPLGGGPE